MAEKVHLLVRTVDTSFFTQHIYCSNTVTYVKWEGSVLHYIQVDFLRVEVIGKLPKFFHGAAENSEKKNGNGIIIIRGVSHVELLVYQVSMA